VGSGLILLKTTRAAVLSPKQTALHFPPNRDQVSHILTDPTATCYVGIAPCSFGGKNVYQLDLLGYKLGLFILAGFQPTGRQPVCMNRLLNGVTIGLAVPFRLSRLPILCLEPALRLKRPHLA
jgi:hypothetical protein